LAITSAKAVNAYLKDLPADRREAIAAVRQVILKHLPKGYEEIMQYGGISYVIPLENYPNTYNGQPLTIGGLASQKNYMSLYLMSCYVDKETDKWFRDEWKARGKKLDMGKCCLRFKKLDDLLLDVIGEVIARMPAAKLIEFYTQSRNAHVAKGK
jgi:hypothetical protein